MSDLHDFFAESDASAEHSVLHSKMLNFTTI